jgi:hypothetical protein
VKLSARCTLIEVRVCLCKLKRDKNVLILVEVQDKHRSHARCAQVEKSLRVCNQRDLLKRLLSQGVCGVEEFNTWKY